MEKLDRKIQILRNGSFETICLTDEKEVLIILNALKRTWTKEEYRIVDEKWNEYDDFGRLVYKMKFL